VEVLSEDFVTLIKQARRARRTLGDFCRLCLALGLEEAETFRLYDLASRFRWRTSNHAAPNRTVQYETYTRYQLG
jgi:hypothetical protein